MVHLEHEYRYVIVTRVLHPAGIQVQSQDKGNQKCFTGKHILRFREINEYIQTCLFSFFNLKLVCVLLLVIRTHIIDQSFYLFMIYCRKRSCVRLPLFWFIRKHLFYTIFDCIVNIHHTWLFPLLNQFSCEGS